VLALQSARMRSPRRVFAACSSQLLTLKNYAQFISFFPPCLPRLPPQLGAAPNFCPAVMAAPGRQDRQVIAGHNTAQGRSTLSVHGPFDAMITADFPTYQLKYCPCLN